MMRSSMCLTSASFLVVHPIAILSVDHPSHFFCIVYSCHTLKQNTKQFNTISSLPLAHMQTSNDIPMQHDGSSIDGGSPIGRPLSMSRIACIGAEHLINVTITHDAYFVPKCVIASQRAFQYYVFDVIAFYNLRWLKQHRQCSIDIRRVESHRSSPCRHRHIRASFNCGTPCSPH